MATFWKCELTLCEQCWAEAKFVCPVCTVGDDSDEELFSSSEYENWNSEETRWNKLLSTPKFELMILKNEICDQKYLIYGHCFVFVDVFSNLFLGYHGKILAFRSVLHKSLYINIINNYFVWIIVTDSNEDSYYFCTLWLAEQLMSKDDQT